MYCLEVAVFPVPRARVQGERLQVECEFPLRYVV